MRISMFKLASFYTPAFPVCYEGDDGAGTGSGDPTTPPGKDTPPADDSNKGALTQEKVNQILAEDRRKHAAKLQALEAELSTALQTSTMTAAQREELEVKMEDMRKQFLTKEQVAAQEKQKLENQYKTELDSWKTRAETAEIKYNDSSVKRALADAAVAGDAFSVEQIVTILRPMTKLADDKVVVDFHDRHVETGEAIVTQLTPKEAVKRMREIPEQYGNLFKANVVSGMGAGSGQATTGKIDISKLTPEQYKKLRNENPSALGF